MRLRDMLAAALRPWVRFKSSEVTSQVDFGEYGVWGPRWSVTLRDAHDPRLVDAIVIGKPEARGRVLGDLCVIVESSTRRRREAAEWQAKRAAENAANDSKAAA